MYNRIILLHDETASVVGQKERTERIAECIGLEQDLEG